MIVERAYSKERSMESFEVLEKKIVQLIALTQKLKTENGSLAKENASLKKKLNLLEEDVLEGNENIEALTVEKEKAKIFVADIIKNIDQLVEGNGQL